MELNLEGVSMARTPEATLARFLGCRDQPRRYEARREACNELADALVHVCGWTQYEADEWARAELRRAGWNFGQ